jgi:hypothetical protein
MSPNQIATLIEESYPVKLKTVILEMLKKDHEARPTATELLERVENWLPEDFPILKKDRKTIVGEQFEQVAKGMKKWQFEVENEEGRILARMCDEYEVSEEDEIEGK